MSSHSRSGAESFEVAGRRIGAGAPCYILAEAGSNHDRDIRQAFRLIDVAAAAGADAVKFQHFSADKIAAQTRHPIASADFGRAKNLHALYKSVEMPDGWLPDLVAYSREKKILFLSTPFDEEAVDLLLAAGVPLLKIASFELVHLPLLRHAARTGLPLVLSTGMATLGEIEEALAAVYGEGNRRVALLHCGINYPAPMPTVNLRAMDTLRDAFQVPVGYSDHTLGIAVPLAAAARGASLYEKHFTCDKGLPGPDHAFALDPAELTAMVRGIRDIEAALGSPVKGPIPEEELHRQRGRRSLFAAVDMPAGTVITREKVAVLRPGVGLMPRHLETILGRVVRAELRAHDPITWDCL